MYGGVWQCWPFHRPAINDPGVTSQLRRTLVDSHNAVHSLTTPFLTPTDAEGLVLWLLV